jgi:hypothetical protein
LEHGCVATAHLRESDKLAAVNDDFVRGQGAIARGQQQACNRAV